MKKQLLIIVITFAGLPLLAQQLISNEEDGNTFSFVGACIYTDPNDHQLVQVAAMHLQDVIAIITGYKMPLVHEQSRKGNVIIIKWVADNIIIKSSKHYIDKPGKHTVRIWMDDPGLALQKLVMDLGGLQSSYRGLLETIVK